MFDHTRLSMNIILRQMLLKNILFPRTLFEIGLRRQGKLFPKHIKSWIRGTSFILSLTQWVVIVIRSNCEAQ